MINYESITTAAGPLCVARDSLMCSCGKTLGPHAFRRDTDEIAIFCECHRELARIPLLARPQSENE